MEKEVSEIHQRGDLFVMSHGWKRPGYHTIVEDTVSSWKHGLGRNPVENKNRVGLAYNAQEKQS